MAGQTFVEKILGAKTGSIVFKKPDIVLSHDNTFSIEKVFNKMGGRNVADPKQLMIVLDHNAPPTNSNLANNYQRIRDFVKEQGVGRFHDVGEGICHQLMANHAKPGMLIVGSDSHTCTAGAFNAMAAGIDRTETAGIWKKGDSWFRVPESVKIVLNGQLKDGVYAKDLALYIIGLIGASGADYMSVEYHGEGVKTLSIADRMVLANLASEMGAKNAAFPPDQVLADYFKGDMNGSVWADEDAVYSLELEIDLNEIEPLVACPHQVENVKSVDEVKGIKLNQALIGTCTNGRIEDLRIAASILKDKQIPEGFQLLITPASRKIFLQAMQEGLAEIFLKAGANLLSPSCGPCLGTGQGIPSDGINVISTANRNFLGRMGNKNAGIYLASPATVAWSALAGEITHPSAKGMEINTIRKAEGKGKVEISSGENRYIRGVWDYCDIDNLNTDQMFAGNLTYEINSSEAEKIKPHLFKGFDASFSDSVQQGDIMLCGENFGCGSSREHPAVGLAYCGVKAVIVKSVSRIFFRSAINQGLPLIVLPEAVEAYKEGDHLAIDFESGKLIIEGKKFNFSPLPEKLMDVLNSGGLINWMLKN